MNASSPKNNITAGPDGDLDRFNFLVALGKSDLLLPEWEENFVASFRHRGSLDRFTPGRRNSTDKLHLKYATYLTQK